MRKIICNNRVPLTFLVCLSLLSVKAKSQISTAKEIQSIQKECYEQLSASEREVLFPTKETRRRLLHEVVRSFSKEKEYMTQAEEEKMVAAMEQEAEKLSPYQDLSSYWIIQNVLKDALPICKALKICTPSYNPKFATLYCKDINADARKVNNEFVLFVNGKLINFCYQMTKAIIETIAIDAKDSLLSISYSKADMIRRMTKDTQLQKRFIDQLRYVYSGKKYSRYVQPSDYNPFVGELTHYMEYFLISHELYHASKRHDPKSLYRFSDNETFTESDSLLMKRKIATGWSYEILADYYGQFMLNQYSELTDRKYFTDMAKLGGLLFLTFDHVYSKAEYALRYGERRKRYSSKDIQQIGNIVTSITNKKVSDSVLKAVDWKWVSEDHPPFELRSLLLADGIQDTALPKGEKEAFFTLGKNLISAIDYLYTICEPELFKIAKQTKLQ